MAAPKVVIYGDLDRDASEKEDGPLSFFVMALVCFVVAYFSFQYLSDLEHTGGSVRVNVIVAALYKLLGKWGVAGLFCAAGATLTHNAIKKWRSE